MTLKLIYFYMGISHVWHVETYKEHFVSTTTTIALCTLI